MKLRTILLSSPLFLAFTFVWTNVHAEENEMPLAEQVIAESNRVMSGGVHYRMLSQGLEISIYQKSLPDGSLAMLTDISAPVKKTTIMYGEKSYDLYLDQKIAINTNFLFAGMKNQSQFTKLLSDAKNFKAPSRIIRMLNYEGKDCYEIETQIPQEFRTTVPKELQKSLPVKNRFVIDSKNYQMYETEAIAQDGTSISKVQFRDIEQIDDLTDDIFQLPQGFNVLAPESMKEYALMTSNVMHPPTPPPDFKPSVPPPYKRLEPPSPKPLPPPNSGEQNDKELLSKKPKSKLVLFVFFNAVVISMIVGYYLKRKKKVS